MQIKILGAESLGVRSLCCVVTMAERKVVIDPGLALGYHRHGLLPHPAQVAVGEQVRRTILHELQGATDVVMSHFHGDHVPLPDANPYQLSVKVVAPLLRPARIWAKGPEGLSHNMLNRKRALEQTLERELPDAEKCFDGPLAFSASMPHGDRRSRLGTVMMTRMESQGFVFVHASDIQLLDRQAISAILAWEPDLVLVGGPPLYLRQFSRKLRQQAWENALQLARQVDTLVIDHHLLRNEEGLNWLERLTSQTGNHVICAADLMGRRRLLLEAQRQQLYEDMPVPEGWHAAYARGEADTQGYRMFQEGDAGADACTMSK